MPSIGPLLGRFMLIYMLHSNGNGRRCAFIFYMGPAKKIVGN